MAKVIQKNSKAAKNIVAYFAENFPDYIEKNPGLKEKVVKIVMKNAEMRKKIFQEVASNIFDD